MEDIFVAGVGMTKFGRHFDHSYKELAREAIEQALTDAGASKADVKQAFFASCVIGLMHDQHMIPGHVALRSMGFEGIPIFNLEGLAHLLAQPFIWPRTLLGAGLVTSQLLWAWKNEQP